MSIYNQPLESLSNFNTAMFGQPDDTISQAEGGQLYLSKTVSDTSTAPTTTFNGAVIFNTQPPSSNTTPSLPTHLATLDFLTSTYQTIAGMTAYLTTSAAALTYQTIANMTNYVSRTGNVIENITGLKTFTNNIEIFDSSTALDEPSLILRTISGASGSSVIKYSGSNLSINNTNSSGDILFQTSGNNRLGITSATTTIYNALTCSSQATFNTLCPISSVSPSQDNHLTRRDFVLGQGFTTLSLVQSNANTFSSTTTFSVIPICSVNATANNQLVNWQTLNGQGFTTLTLVQSNANTFSSTTTFSVIPVCSINPSLNTHLVNKFWIDTYFLTIANASSTYLTITNAASTYLTTSAATSTYLTITNAASTYLTTALASTTYQPISLMTNYLTTANAASTYLTQTNAASTYLTITNAASTYLTTALASTTYQPISLMVNYLTTANAASTYLTITNAASTYLTTALASTTYQPISLMVNYLTTANATSTYLTITTAASTYLTTAIAATTYLTQANATSTYLTITNAATTYLTQAIAASTYLTISNATSTYLSITNAASTYLTQANATSTYLSITNAASTYLTQANAISTYARLSSTNTFTNINTFSNTTNLNGQLNLKNNFLLYDLTSPNTKNIRINQSGDDIFFTPDPLVGGANTNYYFSALNSGGANVNILKLTSSDATINGNAVITGNSNVTGTSTLGATNINGNAIITGNSNVTGTSTLGATNINGTTNISGATTISNALTLSNDTTYSAATINLNSSTSSHSVNLFSAITSGTINIFSSLANSAVNMFSSSSNNTTLNINAKVKFRQVKLYNQVKTITGTATLIFELEETILINSAISGTITLPLINSTTQLGMTFNFIKNYTNVLITFTTQGTNTIMLNGSATGITSSILLGFGQTSTQLVCMEIDVGSGIYNWVVMNSSLPPQITNPPGSIIQMAGTSVPPGYLACSGGLFLTTTYPQLYAIIGLSYGGGSGFFGIPNFNDGSFLRGFGGNSAAYGTQQADAIENHTHSFTYNGVSRGSSQSTTVTSIQTSGGAFSVVTTSHNLTSSTETRPINYAVYYCIKY